MNALQYQAGGGIEINVLCEKKVLAYTLMISKPSHNSISLDFFLHNYAEYSAELTCQKLLFVVCPLAWKSTKIMRNIQQLCGIFNNI